MAQYKKIKITVNGKEIETFKEGKFLWLELQLTGITGHSIKNKNKGNASLTNLQIFKNLSPKTKSTLVKTLLKLVLEYPPIPIYAASLTQKRNMQTIGIKALEFIDYNEANEATCDQLHKKYNIAVKNISINHRAKKT